MIEGSPDNLRNKDRIFYIFAGSLAILNSFVFVIEIFFVLRNWKENEWNLRIKLKIMFYSRINLI